MVTRRMVSAAYLLAVLLFSPRLRASDAPNGPQPPLIGPTIVLPVAHPDGPLRIVAYGDTRFTKVSETAATNPLARQFLIAEIAEKHPSAIFMTGDLPLIGARQRDWKQYLDETRVWRDENIAVYPTLGNHDVLGGYNQSIANFRATFPDLKGYLYYSVQVGEVYLITLDCTESYAEGSPQRQWLASQLEHLPKGTRFVFFMSHMPMMADLQTEVAALLPAPNELSLRTFLEAEAPKVHAKFVVVNGHIHNYERFERNGISYLISGGGGAKPYRVMVRGPEDLYRDSSHPNFHFLLLDFNGPKANVTMYRVTHPGSAPLGLEIKDRFTLTAP